ncbi:MAG: MarR family transcriptional regulator [Clostridia bacterium]|nr:MarR family transcriptional regulator [Clostridia bacterium]
MTNLRELMGLLHRTVKEHHLACENATTGCPLHRAQHYLLLRLSRFETPPSQKELAAKLHVSAAAAALSLSRLEQAGYIRKTPSGKDSRVHLICLTAEGKKAVEDSVHAFDEVDAKAFFGISEEEKALFSRVLEKMLCNLKKD